MMPYGCFRGGRIRPVCRAGASPVRNVSSRGDRLSSVSTRRSPLLEKRPRDLRFTFSTRFERATRDPRPIGISIFGRLPGPERVFSRRPKRRHFDPKETESLPRCSRIPELLFERGSNAPLAKVVRPFFNIGRLPGPQRVSSPGTVRTGHGPVVKFFFRNDPNRIIGYSEDL